MVRGRRSVTEAPGAQRRSSAAPSISLVSTAERMVGQIEALVSEIALLRHDNDALRSELREAVALLERASSALGGAELGARGRRGRRAATAGAASKPAPRRRRGQGGGKAGRTRATPASVTPDVVRGTIGKLGTATAAEIAAEISRHAGTKVNGRAIRFLAEQAGVRIETVDGQRRYRL
jgi:hypothetical protein